MLVLLRNVWGHLFSSDKEIIVLVANVLPIVAAFQLCDGLSGAMGGVLRGAGKPTLGAIVSPSRPRVDFPSLTSFVPLSDQHLELLRDRSPDRCRPLLRRPAPRPERFVPPQPSLPLPSLTSLGSDRSLDRPHRRADVHRSQLDLHRVEDGLGGRGRGHARQVGRGQAR